MDYPAYVKILLASTDSLGIPVYSGGIPDLVWWPCKLTALCTQNQASRFKTQDLPFKRPMWRHMYMYSMVHTYVLYIFRKIKGDLRIGWLEFAAAASWVDLMGTTSMILTDAPFSISVFITPFKWFKHFIQITRSNELYLFLILFSFSIVRVIH